MKLLISQASPYARKCRMTAIEKGITGIEEISVNPMEEPDKLNHLNPLGKIPCLIYENDKTLFDSPVICAYFDHIGTGPQLTPKSGAEHWAVRRHEALLNGILDSALELVHEFRKPEEKHTQMWIARWNGAIDRALFQINNEIDQLRGDISTSQICLGASIGYLQFRMGSQDWLGSYPELQDWYKDFIQRPSMQQTLPQ